MQPFTKIGSFVLGGRGHHRRNLGAAQGPASCCCVTSGSKSRTSNGGLSSRFGEESGVLVQHPEAQVPGAPPEETASVGPGDCTWFLLQPGLEAYGCLWRGVFGGSWFLLQPGLEAHGCLWRGLFGGSWFLLQPGLEAHGCLWRGLFGGSGRAGCVGG